MIFDASVLISFGSAQALKLLQRHFVGRSYVADYVERVELARGLGLGKPDLLVIDRVRWITSATPTGLNELRLLSDLILLIGKKGRGEAEGIALAKCRNWIFGCDDEDACIVANTYRVSCVTTVDILNTLVSKKHLGLNPAKAIAQRMQSAHRNVDPNDIR